MTYAGLKITDKPALLDAKANGAEWVARDANFIVYGFVSEPVKSRMGWKEKDKYGAVYVGTGDTLPFVKTMSDKPYNIDLALAQIAEMERAEKPLTIDERATDDIVLAEVYSLREQLKIAASIIHKLDPNYDVTEFLHQVSSADFDQREEDMSPLTWNERINQMTVEEKADVAVILSKRCARALEKESCPDITCWQCFIEFLNSPYTEGETE